MNRQGILLMKNLLPAIIILLCPHITFAQFLNTFSYKAETGINLSSGENNPLWLTANKNGLSTLDKEGGYISAGAFRGYEINKEFSYELGVELAGAYNHTGNFIVHQAYVGIRYHFLELNIGSRERFSELNNPLLSTGGITFSGNSRPIPQIRVGFPEYVSIPGFTDWFHIRGHLAYGRFTDDNFQHDFAKGKSKYNEDVLYHSRALFIKIGKNTTPVEFQGGLEMYAQFGGTTYTKDGKIVKCPSRLKDYLSVLILMSGDETTTVADQVNIYGNHLGSWHASLEYRNADWSIRGYYEHFFEDHSMMLTEYMWKDCLAGIEIKFPKNRYISTFVYEYLGTKDQSGPFLHDTSAGIPDQISANDNYYNHVTYSSWSHWGMGIGNPLLVSPLYNTDGNLSFRSNRVQAHHIGFMGQPAHEMGYRILFSHARHWGTYYNPLQEVYDNASGLFEVTYSPKKMKDWNFKLAFGADHGKLTGNNMGGMLTVRFSK